MPSPPSPAPLTLADCRPGSRVTILSFTAAQVPVRQLAEFGLRPGSEVEVRQQHRLNGVVLAYGEERIALAHETAAGIRVGDAPAP